MSENTLSNTTVPGSSQDQKDLLPISLKDFYRRDESTFMSRFLNEERNARINYFFKSDEEIVRGVNNVKRYIEQAEKT